MDVDKLADYYVKLCLEDFGDTIETKQELKEKIAEQLDQNLADAWQEGYDEAFNSE